MRILCILLLLAFTIPSRSQTRDIKEYMPTENLDMKKDSNKKRNLPKEKKIRYIIKNDSKRILYGNPCVLEQTRRMNFEYAIQIEGLPGTLKPARRLWENTKTWMNLIFLRSPFWKTTLNRRVKDCRRKSGDLVG